MISSDSENAKTYYHYVSDEQGSVSHIIRGEDKESGVSEQGREQDRILNQYEYDVFGNTISCKEQVENRFRYQCEQYDPITRQYYLRARYYNPVIGRFIQEDTYYGDGLNLYEYCRNNTITYKDPTGHNICATQRDLYHKYREEAMNPQEAYQKMRKELGLDSKSGYKDSGIGNGKDPWRGYDSGKTTISLADKIKIDAWDCTPSDELYSKYKNVFDNPKYYNQKTGAINWPKNDGFASSPIDEVLQPGTRIDRYGSDFGSFTSPEGIPYEMRAVAPGTDLKPYSVFEVVEPINVKAGEIAPWFDEPGGGIQYLLPDTVDELLDVGILRRIK